MASTLLRALVARTTPDAKGASSGEDRGPLTSFIFGFDICFPLPRGAAPQGHATAGTAVPVSRATRQPFEDRSGSTTVATNFRSLGALLQSLARFRPYIPTRPVRARETLRLTREGS